jgi:hypothetical protein
MSGKLLGLQSKKITVLDTLSPTESDRSPLGVRSEKQWQHKDLFLSKKNLSENKLRRLNIVKFSALSLEPRLSDGQRIIKIGLVLETLLCFDQNICRTLKVIVADMSH